MEFAYPLALFVGYYHQNLGSSLVATLTLDLRVPGSNPGRRKKFFSRNYKRNDPEGQTQIQKSKACAPSPSPAPPLTGSGGEPSASFKEFDPTQSRACQCVHLDYRQYLAGALTTELHWGQGNWCRKLVVVVISSSFPNENMPEINV